MHCEECDECHEALWVALDVAAGVIVGARPGAPPPRQDEAEPSRALVDFVEDSRNLGLGLMRGELEDRGTFGLLNDGELLQYWTRDESFAAFPRRGEPTDVPRWLATLEKIAGAPLTRSGVTSEEEAPSFGGMRVSHIDLKK